MAGSRVHALVVVALATFIAAPGEGDAYPHLTGQEHVGGRCTPDDVAVAGGTVVGAGGQVVAGGGGTGVGCDTFWAYELRSGEPTTREPFVEPATYLNPGRASGQGSVPRRWNPALRP